MVDLMAKKIIVTGGSGFIGSRVCEVLVGMGNEVRNVDLSPPTHGEKGGFVHGDIRKLEDLKKAFAGFDAVVHLAAQVDVQSSIAHPAHDFEINAIGTLNVLEACRASGIRKVAYASSAAVYGDVKNVPVGEEDAVAPLSPYGKSKLHGESDVLRFGKEYGMENCALRLFNVYGKRQKKGSAYSGVITKFAEALFSGAEPKIYGDGKQTRDFVHVDDVARAFALALGCNGCESAINIGSGREISILQLWETMCEIAGKKITPEFLPANEGDIARSVADISLAKKKLGFEPKVLMEEGLKGLLSEN